MKDSVYIIDGLAYVYRAYHSMPKLTNRHGHPVGALMGVHNLLNSLIRRYKPSRAVVVFDAPGKNFRHELYCDYKANRPPMPVDLVEQMQKIYALTRAMGFNVETVPGVEADDVIGTLCKKLSSRNHNCLIFSSDKDLTQLVCTRVSLVCPYKDRVIKADQVKEKFGVAPDRIIDYLTLVGDSADNIPGIPGVGPKTAARWLKKFGSLQGIIDQCNSIKGKAGCNLRDNLHLIELYKKLVTIKCDVKLNLEIEKLNFKESNNEVLQRIRNTIRTSL
ncbi:MAG: 5'-3' exonuclease H3TH domain-containing protein [Vulcanimicrobiota bacterium]